MNSRLSVWVVACAAGMSLFPSTADAFCRMTTGGQAQVGSAGCDETGIPLAWTRPCLSYAIDQRGSSSMDFADVEVAVDTAFLQWTSVTCDGEPVDLSVTPLQSSTCERAEFNSSGGNVNTIAFLDPWQDECGERFDANAFAVTVVWHNKSTREILDADMLINENLGPYDDCPASGCPPGAPGRFGPADLQSIITHEAGHFFGIGHTDIEEATMFPSAARQDVSKRTLAQDDMDGMCAAYPPGSVTGTCNAAPIGGLDLNCDDNDSSCTSGTGSNSGCSVSTNTTPLTHALWPGLALGLLMVSARRRAASRGARS